MIEKIASKNNDKVKFATSLKESKNRKKYGLFLDETFHSLEMALSANLLKEVFCLKKLDLPENINQYIVDIDILKKLSYSLSPEVVFIAKIPTFSPKQNFNKILYLDHISDPGNMGTLIRTALAFNYDAVIYSDNSVSPYNDKVIAASKGSLYKIPVFCESLKEYKTDHQIIVSSLSEKAQSVYETKLQSKHVLVLGNETHGVSEETLKLANDIVIIPINKKIDSLNVSVAGGILMSILGIKQSAFK